MTSSGGLTTKKLVTTTDAKQGVLRVGIPVEWRYYSQALKKKSLTNHFFLVLEYEGWGMHLLVFAVLGQGKHHYCTRIIYRSPYVRPNHIS